MKFLQSEHLTWEKGGGEGRTVRIWTSHTCLTATHEERNSVSQQGLLSCKRHSLGPDLSLPLRADPYSNTETTRITKAIGKLEACQSRAQKLAGVPVARSQDYG